MEVVVAAGSTAAGAASLRWHQKPTHTYLYISMGRRGGGFSAGSANVCAYVKRKTELVALRAHNSQFGRITCVCVCAWERVTEIG